MKKLVNIIWYFLLIFFCTAILALSLRGLQGNPNSKDISSIVWKEQGPFELSPERGRFALLYSLVENKSFYFSRDLAQFAAPDVGTHNGKYVSLFAPLVSFVAMPGYVIGRYFGLAQVGAFAMIAIFALLNVFLIRSIAIMLGSHKIPATVAGLTFLFATPAFAYAVTLYQHHISTFLILLSLWVLLKSKKPWTLFVVFFLCALSIPLDYPNLFLMFPIGIYALGRIVSYEQIKGFAKVKIHIFRLLTPLAMVIPILFFMWFNQSSYGNPFQLSGTVQTAEFKDDHFKIDPQDLETKIKEDEHITEPEKKSAIAFFNTRDLLNGFYIHFVSPDRGMLYFTPVVFFGLVGLILSIKKKLQFSALFTAILGANLLLYSMWGDPWGGWGFGSRYLIPSYAILSILIALLLTQGRKKTALLISFVLVAYYSIAVNILGGLTTNAMPPKIQVLELEKISGTVQKYTYMRNWDLILLGHSKSFVYQTYLESYLSAGQFYIAITLSLITLIWFLMLYYITLPESKKI